MFRALKIKAKKPQQKGKTMNTRTQNNQNHTDHRAVSAEDPFKSIEEYLAGVAAAQAAASNGRADKPPSNDAGDRTEGSNVRQASQVALDLAGGQVAARKAIGAMDRAKVIDVTRRVASRKTRGMTDAQVIEYLANNDGLRDTISGHLFERLDADDLKWLYDMRKRFRLPEGRFLELASEHNRKGIDGVYKGARKKGSAVFAQHKLSESSQQVRNAARKAPKGVRAKTEVVVPRGAKKKISKAATEGVKSLRESGHSVKGVRGMVEKAADPGKATQAGAAAAKNLTLKAGAGAAVLGAGMSVAFDANKVRKGELSVAEAAENAAWAGGEAALCTAATGAATVATAPAIAAGTTALAGSALAGTTAMAAGLATLGPLGVGIGVGIGVGFAVKKVRSKTRGTDAK